MREFFHRVRFRRDHRWAPRHLSDYLDGELASSRRRRIDRHTEECPDCRWHLVLLRRTLRALHRLPPPVGGADARRIAASVHLRLGERPPP
jgi:anti-sigma factor RsiW